MVKPNKNKFVFRKKVQIQNKIKSDSLKIKIPYC